MLKSTSKADLLRFNPTHSALPVLADFINRIITQSYKTEYPYNPENDGYIMLIEEGDTDRPLTEIWGDDAYSLIDVPWEGITRDESGKYFIAIYLANNHNGQYGLVFIILDADWIYGELRECIEAHLDE